MIKKVGKDKKLIRRATCKNCGTKLEFLPKDIKHKFLSCMGESAGGYDYIDCPDCKQEVEVRS